MKDSNYYLDSNYPSIVINLGKKGSRQLVVNCKGGVTQAKMCFLVRKEVGAEEWRENTSYNLLCLKTGAFVPLFRAPFTCWISIVFSCVWRSVQSAADYSKVSYVTTLVHTSISQQLLDRSAWHLTFIALILGLFLWHRDIHIHHRMNCKNSGDAFARHLSI